MMLSPVTPSFAPHGKVKAKLKPMPLDFRSRRYPLTLVNPPSIAIDDDESPLKDAIRVWLESK